MGIAKRSRDNVHVGAGRGGIVLLPSPAEAMNSNIAHLIEALKRGDYVDPEEKVALLAAALQEAGEEGIECATALLVAPQTPLRMAALDLARTANNARLNHAILALISDEEPAVRTRLAKALGSMATPEAHGLLRKLLGDGDSDVRCAAAQAAAPTAAHVPALLAALNKEVVFRVQMELITALAKHRQAQVIHGLMGVMAREEDSDVVAHAARALTELFAGATSAVAKRLLPKETGLLSRVHAQLQAQSRLLACAQAARLRSGRARGGLDRGVAVEIGAGEEELVRRAVREVGDRRGGDIAAPGVFDGDGNAQVDAEIAQAAGLPRSLRIEVV